LCTYRRNSLIDLIGKLLSPIILILISIVIIYGIYTGNNSIDFSINYWNLITENLLFGYNTLDLLGAIFFGYIILEILKAKQKNNKLSDKEITYTTFKASLIGGTLLILVYSGIALLGTYHGQGLEALDGGKMFVLTMQRIINHHGTLIVGSIVFLACLTTIIALASVVTEYLSNNILKGYIEYIPALISILIVAMLLSQFELEKLMFYSEPIIYILYPGLIVLTFCNIAYSLIGFKPVKIPVLLTLLVSSYFYVPQLLARISQSSAKVAQETKNFDFDSPVQQ
jgi:branched-chain amino acid:cation transporter, LIVCS family